MALKETELWILITAGSRKTFAFGKYMAPPFGCRYKNCILLRHGKKHWAHLSTNTFNTEQPTHLLSAIF